MKDEYDFSKSRENPYAKRLKKQITLDLDKNTLDYFKTHCVTQKDDKE